MLLLKFNKLVYVLTLRAEVTWGELSINFRNFSQLPGDSEFLSVILDLQIV